MSTPEPIILSGNLVRLEPLRTDHVEALWAAARYPELWRWSIAPMDSQADIGAYVEAALTEQDAGRALPFVQVDVASGEIVGSTRYGNIDLPNLKLEIGWTWLTPRAQRSGINTEAKLLLLTHAFEQLGCRRVELKTDARNSQSRTAMERIGATYEGTFRRHIRCHDGFQRDSAYFSVISEEWPHVKARIHGLLQR